MATKIKPGGEWIKYKTRTPTGSTEYDGGLDFGLVMAFYNVPTPERRLAVIEELKKAHEKLCKPQEQI